MIKCSICENDIIEIFNSKLNISVSSDGYPLNNAITIYKCNNCGHIQKNKNINCEHIYNQYKSIDITNSTDQTVYINGHPLYRSDIILNKILSYFKYKNSLLDIGTGTGVFLLSCSKATSLSLHAYDLNDNFKEKILQIKNVQSFYSGDLNLIDKKFDIISLVHVLEHIPNLVESLQTIKHKLSNNGILLIQVPYINNNKNDVVIYDHLSHFSYHTLSKVLLKVFKNVHFIQTDIKKEITVIASDSFIQNKGIIQDNIQINFNYINVINNYLLHQKDKIYIFGTTPISIYFAKVLLKHNKLEGFLDEDELKINKAILGLTIKHPKNVKNVKCFIPLNENIIEKISSKYKKILFIGKNEK